MKYMRELVAGRFGRTLVFGLKTSGSARYISGYTNARSAMASVEQESVSHALGYRDVIDHKNEYKAFKGVPVGFSF